MNDQEIQAAVEAMRQLRKAAQIAIGKAGLTDAQAIEVSTVWPEWSGAGVAYAADDVVRHANALYRVEQAHTSQADWAPDAAPSLFSRIDIAEDGVEVWTQPTGAHNAYGTGDRVHWPAADGQVYVSKVDGNRWPPAEGGNDWWGVEK